MWNDVANVYARFRNFPLCINKVLGIFHVTTRTTVVALRDPSRSKKLVKDEKYEQKANNHGNNNGNNNRMLLTFLELKDDL